MTFRQTRQFAMLVRSRDFVQVREGLFPEGSVGRKAFNALVAALKKIAEFNGAKQSMRWETRDTRLVAKNALKAQLAAIARSARVLAKDVPDADAKFRLPQRQSDVAVHQSGLLFLKEAAVVKDTFINCGLPATFLEELQQAVTAFEQAIAGRSNARTGSVVSRKEIAALLKEGIDAVRSLDALVANALGNDRLAMNEWKGKRHVDRVRTSGAAVVTPDAVAPATTAANAGDDPLRRAS